jgi:NADH-quinone oxidoreductase subunit F
MPETSLDLHQLEPILSQYARLGRTALLPILHEVQTLFGYIPPNAIQKVSHRLGISVEEVEKTVDFYPLFYRQPAGKTVIHVCNNPVCANAGAEAVMKRLSQTLEARRAAGEQPGTLTIEYSPCLGLCEHAPAMIVQGAPVARADSVSYEDLVSGKLRHPRSIVRNEVAILTANCGKNRVNWLALYRASQGYRGLEQALQMSPAQVIETIKASGLLGRGGAAFPTGNKWETAAQAPGEPKYILCNADEAEPGSFKDRVLLEDEPHLILEGMLIAGYAVGASKGYIYIRGEYLFQYQVMLRAVEEARQAGFLGEHVMGTGFSFDVEVRRGAGTYVAGEETAQIESIEGKPAYPRPRPPFPTSQGLFGKPTVVNNVETLANVPYILRVGAAEYRKIGTEASPGPKLFCLSGDVKMPGLYEVPFGITFRHLLEDLAGGVRDGHSMKAALFGGAAGAFATPDQLDLRLTVEDLAAAGLPLGSGVITIFDETRDLRDVCLRQARFFAEESCGICPACQEGTRRQWEILSRLAEGKGQPEDYTLLRDTSWNHPDRSRCGVGQMAALPILSALDHWPDLFKAP